MNGIIKCPVCGKPYRWYSHTVADQSACPRCVREANEEVDRIWKTLPEKRDDKKGAAQ